MSNQVKIADVRDIAPGEAKVVEAAGHCIALFNVEGMYYALENDCTHAGGPLGEGELDEKTVTCPWHGARFDVTTGNVLSPPARRGVRRYAVTVRGQEVLADLE